MKPFGRYTHMLNAAVRVRYILQDELLQDFSFQLGKELSGCIFNENLKKVSLLVLCNSWVLTTGAEGWKCSCITFWYRLGFSRKLMFPHINLPWSFEIPTGKQMLQVNYTSSMLCFWRKTDMELLQYVISPWVFNG